MPGVGSVPKVPEPLGLMPLGRPTCEDLLFKLVSSPSHRVVAPKADGFIFRFPNMNPHRFNVIATETDHCDLLHAENNP